MTVDGESALYLTDWEAEELLGLLAEALDGRENGHILWPVLQQLYTLRELENLGMAELMREWEERQ